MQITSTYPLKKTKKPGKGKKSQTSVCLSAGNDEGGISEACNRADDKDKEEEKGVFRTNRLQDLFLASGTEPLGCC